MISKLAYHFGNVNFQTFHAYLLETLKTLTSTRVKLIKYRQYLISTLIKHGPCWDSWFLQSKTSTGKYLRLLNLCDFVFLRTVFFSRKNSVLSINSRVGSRACLRSHTHSLRCANLKLDLYLFLNLSKSNVLVRQTMLI